MPKRKLRRPLPRTRVLMVDGEVHVVVDRSDRGLTTKRLGAADAAVVVSALDDVQDDLAARLLGHRRPPR